MKARFLNSGILTLCAVALLNLSHAAETEPSVFRVGISYASFGTVSRNDASAAITAWAATVLKERGLFIKTRTDVFDDFSQLQEALKREEVDAASMTSEEFFRLETKPEYVFLTARRNTISEQYVLLTHRGSALNDVSALKGRTMVRHNSPKTSMAQPWLETLLDSLDMKSAKDFFGNLSTEENPSKAIFKVYFRQADACLVTTNAFALAGELNSQIRKELRVIAFSPPLIPSLFFLRSSYKDVNRNQIESAIRDLHATPAGLQVVTVFQGEKMLKEPLSCLETTWQLLKEYDRIKQASGTKRDAATPPLKPLTTKSAP